VDPGPKWWITQDYVSPCGADEREGEWTIGIDGNEVKEDHVEDIEIEFAQIHGAIYTGPIWRTDG